MEVDINSDIHQSPYLNAIQWIKGQNPKEKYRNLNTLIQSIVNICRDTGTSSAVEIITSQQEIPAALLPLVRILTGIELKSTEAVVEALRSPDILVVNKALRAKWFFDSSNSHVDAAYFMENIFPFVSVRTRLDIVKVLTHGLHNAKGMAENFFNSFNDMFGLEQAMPFLPYCSEKFLYGTILKFKIELSFKMLDKIFQRYPNLAIRYLYLGCRDFDDNKADRKIHMVNLSLYAEFLPKLIRSHVHDYFKLLPYVNYNCGKIGSTRSRALFKNANDFVMKETNTFNSNWPIKYYYHNLSQTQFKEYYTSLHPKNVHQYNFTIMLESLKFYPKKSRIDFMKNVFERVYNVDFFTHLGLGINTTKIAVLFDNGQINEEQFEKLYSGIFPTSYPFNVDDLALNLNNYSKAKMLKLLHKNIEKRDFFGFNAETIFNECCTSEKYFLLLPDEKKLEKAQFFISGCKKRTDSYYRWCCFLPAEQSFNILKLGAECSSAQKRADFLKKMIYSCKIYNDQIYLIKVLKYYIQRHKNERSSTLHSILEYLMDQFNILTLRHEVSDLFIEIVDTAFVKNELFNASVELVDKIFEVHFLIIDNSLRHEFNHNEVIGAMIAAYLKYKIIYRDDTDWTLCETVPDNEKRIISVIMHNIPIIYPENHAIWKKGDKKVKVGLRVISKLHKNNQKIINGLKLRESNTSDLNTKIIRVTDYTWLKDISEYLLRTTNSKTPKYLESFKALMKLFDEEFYLSVIPNDEEGDPPENILSGKANWFLKNNYTLIHNRWEEYFNAAQDMLHCKSQRGAQAAKNFIISIKWHQELPLRFFERCLAEIDTPGSLVILALLVDGETLSKIMLNYIPTSPMKDIYKTDAEVGYRMISFIPTAINLSIPFVSTEILMSMFQHKYTKLVQRSVGNFAQRVDKQTIINFAKQLLNRPVSIKKHGIRMMLSVFTIDEIMVFLTELPNFKHHPTVNVIIANRIFHLFTKYPNDKTWILVNSFIDGLNCNDFPALNVLTNTKLICNPYASLYLNKFLDKIEHLYQLSKRRKIQETEDNDNENSLLNFEETNIKENLLKAVFENASEESVTFLTKETILEILRTYYFRGETRIISLSAINFANKIFSRPFIGRK